MVIIVSGDQVSDDQYRNPKDRGHLELVGRLTCVVHNVHVYVDDKTSGCCLLRFTNSIQMTLVSLWCGSGICR